MKPKSNAAIIKSIQAHNKKTGYRQAAKAIHKKLEAIKNENLLPGAINNTPALFRYGM